MKIKFDSKDEYYALMATCKDSTHDAKARMQEIDKISASWRPAEIAMAKADLAMRMEVFALLVQAAEAAKKDIK